MATLTEPATDRAFDSHEARLAKYEEVTWETKAEVAVLGEKVINLGLKMDEGFNGVNEKMDSTVTPLSQTIISLCEAEKRRDVRLRELEKLAEEKAQEIKRLEDKRLARKSKMAAIGWAGFGAILVAFFKEVVPLLVVWFK